jgi:hypothetical protein
MNQSINTQKMKNVYLFLLVILVLFPGLNTKSQNRDRFPVVRERIVQAKLREIRVNLKLDQVAFDQFRPVYLKYERELSSIDFREMARLIRVDSDSLTAEQADRLIVTQLEVAKSLLEVREKYYKEFRKVLAPQQIIKLYQTEAEMRQKVTQEMKRRLMKR